MKQILDKTRLILIFLVVISVTSCSDSVTEEMLEEANKHFYINLELKKNGGEKPSLFPVNSFIAYNLNISSTAENKEYKLNFYNIRNKKFQVKIGDDIYSSNDQIILKGGKTEVFIIPSEVAQYDIKFIIEGEYEEKNSNAAFKTFINEAILLKEIRKECEKVFFEIELNKDHHLYSDKDLPNSIQIEPISGDIEDLESFFYNGVEYKFEDIIELEKLYDIDNKKLDFKFNPSGESKEVKVKIHLIQRIGASVYEQIIDLDIKTQC